MIAKLIQIRSFACLCRCTDVFKGTVQLRQRWHAFGYNDGHVVIGRLAPDDTTQRLFLGPEFNVDARFTQCRPAIVFGGLLECVLNVVEGLRLSRAPAFVDDPRERYLFRHSHVGEQPDDGALVG
jgi:hypothetical protein